MLPLVKKSMSDLMELFHDKAMTGQPFDIHA